jgi:fermentation-respiration switch protein FrsA (DUF1100 family)
MGEDVNWYVEKLIHTPIQAYHGDIDEVVSVYESVGIVASIDRKGGHAALKLFHGVNHNAWEYAYNDELVEWFIKHSL